MRAHNQVMIAQKIAQSGGGGAFTYYSSSFNGTNTSVTRSPAGITNSKLGLLSTWVRWTSNFERTHFVHCTSGYFEALRTAGDVLQIVGYDSGATLRLDLRTSDDVYYNDGFWHHILASWDTGTAGASYIYVDGVDKTSRVTHTDGAINYSAGDVGIMSTATLGEYSAGLLSEYYFTTPASFFDISVSSNRDKFFNSGTSKPVDLGADGSTPTGTQPLIYFHNPYSSFGTNLGSISSFTTNGTIGDGGSNKP